MAGRSAAYICRVVSSARSAGAPLIGASPPSARRARLSPARPATPASAPTPLLAAPLPGLPGGTAGEEGRGCRSDEHTSELQSLMRNTYAVLCLKTQKLTLRLPILVVYPPTAHTT